MCSWYNPKIPTSVVDVLARTLKDPSGSLARVDISLSPSPHPQPLTHRKGSLCKSPSEVLNYGNQAALALWGRNSQVSRQASRQSLLTALSGHVYCLRSCGTDISTTTVACVYLRAVAAFWSRRPLSGTSRMRMADMPAGGCA